jgi:hypothetical protein
VSLCARVAWAIEDGGLNASPEGLARTPPSQQTGLLPEPSSPINALLSPAPRMRPEPILLVNVSFPIFTTADLVVHSCFVQVRAVAFPCLPANAPGRQRAPAAAAVVRYLYLKRSCVERSAPRHGLHANRETIRGLA